VVLGSIVPPWELSRRFVRMEPRVWLRRLIDFLELVAMGRWED
jgi:hypothetical protein